MAKNKESIPAVIYARYSSSGQREESLTGQIRDCKAYAKRCGYSIIHEYTDAAKTGTNDQRPAFQQMISDASKHKFEAVIVWKLDRFSRDKYDAARYKHVLKQQGVRVISAMEPISESPEGVIMESLLEGMAQYYSMDLSLKVKRGNRESALEHKTIGLRMIGYVPDQDDHFAIDQKTAPIVKRIFTEYDSGKSMKDIYTGLNNDGFRTLQGKQWTKSSLQHILRNERYTGTYIFGDYREEDVIPPIIDKDTFKRVQTRMDWHKKKPAASRDVNYLLTGKIFCGKCGSPMIGESAKSKTGRIYHYYRDTKTRKKSCSGIRVRTGVIEDAVIDELYKIATDQRIIDRIADSILKRQEERIQDDTELRAIDAQLADVDSKITNLEKAIEAGIITKTTKSRMEELEAQHDQLEQKRKEEELNKPPRLTKDFILFCFEEMAQGDLTSPAFREKLVEVYLEAVYVYDDGTLVLQSSLPGEKKKKLTLKQADDLKEHSSCLEASGLPYEPNTNPENSLSWITVLSYKGLTQEHAGIAAF